VGETEKSCLLGHLAKGLNDVEGFCDRSKRVNP